MLPAYVWGIPFGADLDNHFRFALPLHDEISAGRWFPGWLAESNNGFGDARFRFYPPLVYYALAAARWLIGDWYSATMLVFTLLSIGGSLGIYFWSRTMLESPAAVFAAVLFAFVPYHLTQFYQASLLAEFAATAVLPNGFLFVHRLAVNNDSTRQRLFHIAALAIAFALLVTTHLPAAIIGSIGLGLYALLCTDWKQNKKGLAFAAAAVLLGLFMSSWFWVKLVAEIDWIQAGTAVESAYYDYRNNFLFSPFSNPHLNTWFGGLIAALTVGLLLPSIAILPGLFRSPRDGDVPIADGSRRGLKAAAIVTAFSLFMTTDLSRPVWAMVPKLKDIQFPYRWLALTSVMICPLVAASLPFWRQRITRGLKPRHIPILVIFTGALVYGFYEVAIYTEFLRRQPFAERMQAIRGSRSFSGWLPPGASELKDLAALEGPIDTGDRDLISADSQSHVRRFSVAAGPEVHARIRSYYYPLWQAAIIRNGERHSTATTQAPDGTLLVSLPPEAAEIEVLFAEPPRTPVSQVISASAWGIAFILLLPGLIGGKSARPLRPD